MQYLLKISLKDTPAWRMIAVDGAADRAHMAALICAAFGYPEGRAEFCCRGECLAAGSGGRAAQLQQLQPFDALDLKQGERLEFRLHLKSGAVLSHAVEVMKTAEHLYCFMPSCLVGAGEIPEQLQSAADVAAYYESQEEPRLDLRVLTARMRALGVQRPDPDAALRSAGAAPLRFGMK